MRLLQSLCILLAGLAVAGSALAAQPVALRPDAAEHDGAVTLGDLFDAAGDAADTVVATDRAGTGLVLDASRVQMLALAHGLQWPNPTGITRIIVHAGASRLSTVTVTARPAHEHEVEVLSYARDINTGDVVQAADLLWTKAVAAGPDAPHDAQAVIGMAARRPLHEGSLVALHDVTAPQVIKRDDVIALVYGDGAITLTLQVKALDNAVVGQTLTVMNLNSKKIIQAVASGPGQAMIGPQAEQLRAAARSNPALVASIR